MYSATGSGRRSVGIALALVFAGCAAGTPPLAVTGTAAWRERIVLPSQAVFEASVLDVARADAAAVVLGQARIESPQTPVAFTIPVDAARLRPQGRYVVRATVRLDSQLLFTTDTVVPVFGTADVRRVELLLRRVGTTP